MKELGRVVDTEALAKDGGGRARLRVEVPRDWAGLDVEIVAPARLRCDRCEGGGCDGCDRSGALRLEGDDAHRTLDLRLPSSLETGVLLRIGRPFGDGRVTQLLVEIGLGTEPSSHVRKVDRPVTSSSIAKPPLDRTLVFLVVCLVLCVGFAIARWR